MRYVRILVVGDESIIGDDIENRLSAFGFTVVGVATSSDDAIQQANATRPDLVLMGVKLSGEIDGIEAAHYIWQHLDIPIVYLTASLDTATLDRAKATQPYGYLIQPVPNAILRSTIEIAIHRHRAEKWERQRTLELQREVAYRKRVEKELRTMQQAIASSTNGIVLTGMDENVTYVNPAFLHLWGYNRDRDVQGSAITHFWENRIAINQTLSILREGGSWSGELVTLRNDGTTFVAQVSGSLVKNDDETPIGMMLSIVDATNQKEAEAALQRYATELEARNEELDAYGHTVAHELKNPLSIINGFAELIQASYADSDKMELREALHHIKQSSTKMLHIIDALLLLGAVRQANMVTETLDMGAIVHEARERLRTLQLDRHATIKAPETWPAALGYAPWVEEVWVNLLSNAIKYGVDRPIVEIGSTPQPDGMIQFWVRDNGPGLTPEDQARLFIPFKQLDRSGARGHGLGLSIVRRIVEKLGGVVGVDSELGPGSCFHFSLPGVPDADVASQGNLDPFDASGNVFLSPDANRL